MDVDFFPLPVLQRFLRTSLGVCKMELGNAPPSVGTEVWHPERRWESFLQGGPIHSPAHVGSSFIHLTIELTRLQASLASSDWHLFLA